MLKQIIKALTPPALLQLRHLVQPFYGIKGDFASWEEAEAFLRDRGLKNYEADNILQTVWESIRQVREGNALFERDGVLFYEQAYNYPLLAALLYALRNLGGDVDILDFGGSLGSTYYQNRELLSAASNEVRWSIVEQEKFVRLGQEKLPEISFFTTIDEFLAAGKSPDLLLLSSVLQYFDDPYAYVAQMLKANFQYIIIDRTFFNFDTDKDRLAIQYVSPEIYEAQYPVWLLSYEKMMRIMTKAGYREIFHWDSFDRMPVRIGWGRTRALSSKGILMKYV